MGKEGNSQLKSITCLLLLISPTSSPSWGGTSPIHHPRAPFQSPKVTKSAVKITRSCLAGIIIKEGDNYLKFITCSVFLICPTPSPSWGGTSPIHHPKGLFQSPKVTKNATNMIRSCLAGPFMGKEGNRNLKLSPVQSFRYLLPLSPPGMVHHSSITPELPSR